MTVEDILEEKLRFLRSRGVETSRFELRMLLGFVLGKDAASVLFHKDNLTSEQIEKFAELTEKRAQHRPIDKIIGHKGFYKYDFTVSEDVLSPRADTETLVEQALEQLKNIPKAKILELGIGSGCILLSLLKEMPQATGVGVDISAKALKVAAGNAASLQVEKPRLQLKCASWFDENIAEITGRGFDLIISNPPYIPSAEIAGLDDEVKNFDPLIALDGGDDGLRDYRQISVLAFELLKDGGLLVFEAGNGQAAEIAEIGRSNHLLPVKTIRDLGNVERCIILKKDLHLAQI